MTRKRPPTPQIRNERLTKGAKAAKHKEQVFPNMERVFPEGFPNRSVGFSKITTNRKEGQLTTGFPNKWVFPKKGHHPRNTTAKGPVKRRPRKVHRPRQAPKTGMKAQKPFKDRPEAQKSPREGLSIEDGQRNKKTN